MITNIYLQIALVIGATLLLYFLIRHEFKQRFRKEQND